MAKVLAKVLTNRVKLVLGELLSESQNVFIKCFDELLPSIEL